MIHERERNYGLLKFRKSDKEEIFEVREEDKRIKGGERNLNARVGRLEPCA